MEHDFDWFLQHPVAYESLTVEQLHILGNNGTVDYGDTATAENDDSPAVEVAAVTEDKVADETPVVLAKDGIHTIPFEEHRAAKDRAHAAEERTAELESLAAEQSELIESLKAAKVADAGTGDTVAQDEVLAKFVADYPEVSESVVPWVNSMISANKAAFDAQVAALKAEFSQLLAPIQKTAQEAAVDAHFGTIADAHSDYQALIDSGKVDDWVATLPTFARAGAEQVMAKGTAAEVVELLTEFKSKMGIMPEVPEVPEVPRHVAAGLSKSDAKLAADIAIAKARNVKPVSLTDLPATIASDTNEDPTDAAGWSRKFANMSAEDIMKSL